MRGPAFFAYSNNYLIDVKVGIIMDVEASRAIRQAEVGASKTMIERTQERFDIKPERLAGDTAYGSGANLNWLVKDKDIAPHIPVIDKSKREDGTFSREDFTFDKDHNVYICPANKILTTTGKVVNDGDILLYRAKARDCRGCLLKAQCCPKASVRKIPRSIYEEARDVARALAKTEAFTQSCRDSKRHETDMPAALRNVRSQGQSGKYMLAWSFSDLDQRGHPAPRSRKPIVSALKNDSFCSGLRSEGAGEMTQKSHTHRALCDLRKALE